jgi:hypothetical protein
LALFNYQLPIENYKYVDAIFQCASCGEWNETVVDESAGHRQGYVEDCQVCCKPNLLRIHYDQAAGEFVITAELE